MFNKSESGAEAGAENAGVANPREHGPTLSGPLSCSMTGANAMSGRIARDDGIADLKGRAAPIVGGSIDHTLDADRFSRGRKSSLLALCGSQSGPGVPFGENRLRPVRNLRALCGP